jgi:hypothetical protein
VNPTVPQPLASPSITFGTTAKNADESQLLQRAARIPVSWSVANRPDGSNLVFEQVWLDNSAINVELPRDNPWVASSGNGLVSPLLPMGSSTLRLQVRLVRQSDGMTLAARDLSLPVVRGSAWRAADPVTCMKPPYSPAVGLREGIYGVVRSNITGDGLPVWDVPAPVHQVVGKLLKGEKFVTLEGPYCYPYPWPSDGTLYPRLWRVRSTAQALEGWIEEYGVGVPNGLVYTVNMFYEPNTPQLVYAPEFCDVAHGFLAPVGLRVGQQAHVTGQAPPKGLPVFDAPNGYVGQDTGKAYLKAGETVNVLDGPYCHMMLGHTTAQAGFRIWKVRSEGSQVEGWTPEYWSSMMSGEKGYYLEPGAGGDGNSAAGSATFAANPNPVAHGGTLTLTWNVPGAGSVNITRLSETSLIHLEAIGGTLPGSGSLSYTIPDAYVQQIPFLLSSDNLVKQTLTVSITCPFASHLIKDCPLRQQSIQAAYEQFENGYMIWRGDTGEIYVLFKNGPPQSFEIFRDTWVEGETFDVGQTPPTGRTQPVRGFAKVWATGRSPYSWVTVPGVRDRLGWALGPESGYTMTLEVHPRDWNRPNVLVFSLLDGKVVNLYSETIPLWSIAN